MILDGLITSKGWFRTIGSVLCFAGVYLVPHIALVSDFADAFTALGSAIGGAGVCKAVVAKKIL